MYILFDSACSLTFGFLTMYGLFIHKYLKLDKISRMLALKIGIIGFVAYPLGLELIAQLISKEPIVYHSDYNITAGGLERMHRFDSTKYKKVYNQLVQGGLIREQQIIKPQQANRKLLSMVHDYKYQMKLCYSFFLSTILEVPVFFLPSFLLRWRILRPMMLATQGTVISCIVALKKGWCINLSGGYHHASAKLGGGGFCVYADITIAIKYLRKYCRIKKIMIVDVDAHQGNGYEIDCIGDENTYIIDIYNPLIYPGDSEAKKGINQQVLVYKSDTDQTYLEKLSVVKTALQHFQPEILIYNAGTDCMVNDPLGRLKISAQGIIQRDETIFRYCQEKGVPVVMLLSGGYQAKNTPTIGDSISNILKKFKRV